MLNIFYGDMKEAVYNTASYFKYDYEDGIGWGSGIRPAVCIWMEGLIM